MQVLGIENVVELSTVPKRRVVLLKEVTSVVKQVDARRAFREDVARLFSFANADISNV
jgi:hypothetical protein